MADRRAGGRVFPPQVEAGKSHSPGPFSSLPHKKMTLQKVVVATPEVASRRMCPTAGP